MRALYDSEAHAIWIDTVDPPTATASRADDHAYPVLVHYDDDRLVGVEIVWADDLPESQVMDALTGLDLDVPSVLAAWRAALAAPDRHVAVGPALAA